MIVLKRIRSQIAFYLSILIVSGMLLISLTAIFSFQGITSVYLSKHFSVFFKTIAGIVDTNKKAGFGINDHEKKNIIRMLKETGGCSIKIIDKSGVIFKSGLCGLEEEIIVSIINSADRAGEMRQEILSQGVHIPFISEKECYYFVAGPLLSASGIHVATIGIMWNLRDLYENLRRIERLLFTYIIINTIVLTAVGVYQIGNITAKPLKKILKKTDSVNIDDISLKGVEGSDFDKLSAAITVIVDDLTEKRKSLHKTVKDLESANSDLRRMQKDIIRAEKMASIGRLSAGLAHEIGNPVGIISGYLEMLKQNGISDHDRMDFAVRADEELRRIDSIIRELMDYARPHERSKIRVSVHEMIKDLIRAYQGSKAIGKIIFYPELEAENDIIKADLDLLRQVFMNLILNSSDAIESSENRDKGAICIVTRNEIIPDSKRQDLIISFKDNGCGLPCEGFDNIFEPFFTTKPPGKGTGLGLSVSAMIIDDLGGKIEALGHGGEGAEMRITIPALDEDDTGMHS